MRLNTPRIAPLQPDSYTPAQREALAPYAARDQLFNIFTTLGRVPEALKAFSTWGSFVLRDSSLPARERELLILRVGWSCRAGYEWAQHARIGRHAGLSAQELEGIKAGPAWESWGEGDRVLLHAADELVNAHFVSDATWGALAARFNERQLMDLVFVVAHYTQVCMMLNTFGVQLDPVLRADPDFQP
ncbi:MAG: carboxymuconolactone decarboxylase family protein [Myxococcales bacterium]|nr:carboxymuconolactone decarboxylase family protein [Myxococcales bacterium]